MIFLASRVWLEFVFDGDKADEAESTLRDDCHTLYSGGPDFEDIDEIETVVL